MAFSTKSVLFDEASSQYATAGDVLGSVLEYNVPWSVELWFKATGEGTLISKQQGIAAFNWRGFQYKVGSSGQIYCAAVSNNSVANQVVFYTTATGFDDGAWHHLAITKATGASYSGGDWHIYVDANDEPLGSSYDALTATIATGRNLQLAARHVLGSEDYLPGNIDDVAVYSAELSQAQVTAHFGFGVPTDRSGDAGLAGYWYMGDGDVSPTLLDHSSGGNNFTLVNSPTIEDDAPAGVLSSVTANDWVSTPVQRNPEVPYTLLSSSGGGGAAATLKFKMRAQDSGEAFPAYVTWIVDDAPDFAGSGYAGGTPTPTGAMIAGSAVVVAQWEET